MITVTVATTAEDVRSAVGFFDRLAAWDAQQSEAYGVTAAFIMELFHTHDADPTAIYRVPGAQLFIARSDGAPAGCVGYDAFDGESLQIHRLYVDPEFRGL